MIRIDHTRIDKYNAAGVLLDGATGDTLPLTASGVTSARASSARTRSSAARCASTSRSTATAPTRRSPPTARCYGQDGVRVTAGSTVNVIDTLLSQNLVQGTGAPTRGAAANNENLDEAAGLRLIGAGAVADPAQQHRRQLLRRLQRRASTARRPTTPSRSRAENNWWGLRAQRDRPTPARRSRRRPTRRCRRTRSTARRSAAGSDAVDFARSAPAPSPTRTAASSPIFNVPGPVNDSAPTVGVSTDKRDLPPRRERRAQRRGRRRLRRQERRLLRRPVGGRQRRPQAVHGHLHAARRTSPAPRAR